MPRVLLVLWLTGVPVSGALAQRPPPTPTNGAVDTLYGTLVPDPYRWLEDLASPAVQAWLRAQGEYARLILDSLPGHATLMERLRQLDDSAPPDVSLPREAGGRWFYVARRRGAETAGGYVREAGSGEERLLVDPRTVPGPGEQGTRRLATFLPSPDGRLVLYGVTTGGAEQVVLRLREVASGRDVEGPFERNQWDETAFWDPGGRAFYYWQIGDQADQPPGDRLPRIRLLRHHLGTSPRSDVPVLSAGSVEAGPGLFPVIDLDPRVDIAFGRLVSGLDGYSAYYEASASSVVDGTPAWRPLFPISDSIRALVPHGSDLYVLTRRHPARVLRTRVQAPDLHTADTILVEPEGATLQNMTGALDGIYVQIFSEGVNRLVRIPWDGAPRPVRLPPGTSVAGADFGSQVRTEALQPGVLLTLQSWTETSAHYRYDPSADRLVPIAVRDRGELDRLDGYLAETVYAPSHDGVRVPLTIVRPERLALDGSLPVVLEGYGAYGDTDTEFRAYRPSPWYEAGGAWATCHVRGGGYHGDAWHRAGQKETKPNSWLDFIACAEYLIREGYTRPERLVAGGGSAGGIAVGRAITERPELFAAAIITNGVLDAVRAETTPNGQRNIPEFGSTATEEGFRGLLAMSAYHHVEPGVRYPAVLLEIGLEDIRVAPWQSAKMAAALQAADSGRGPLLLRVEAAGGHISGAVPAGRRQLLAADNLAFWMAAVGLGFPPMEPGESR